MSRRDRMSDLFKTLPFFAKMLFFMAAVFGFCLYGFLLFFEYVLLFGLIGGAVYLLTLMSSSNPFLQVVGASVGSLVVLSSIAALYIKGGFHLADNGLKILDWLFIIMTAVMMGCFQWIGIDPIYWLLFVVFPMFGVRVAITIVMRSRKRRC